ncbi:efflux RND transporter periplasmic adaptor subunit [Desulfovibrio inopinatus]|uniref:efflux RND transporter periplasmic adaptor subunit n=1 Tax=Desulfovibrio inopinatus TaxID=102109 RepID=UPI00041BD6BA|nr:efflux RND transporter periplasmic adaptor subunit [Desulfovibrio inopinatus]
MVSTGKKSNSVSFKVPYILLLGFIVLGFITACGENSQDEKAQKAAQQQAIPAKVFKTKTEDVNVYGEFVGKTEAVSTVDIRARIEGYLKERLFREGSIVKKGDLLFVIDPSQQEQYVNDAKGQVDQIIALLDKARLDVSRFSKLYKTGAVSREEYDQKTTHEKDLKAQLDRAKANLAEAQLNLGYTKVYAPLTGVIGRAQAKIGALVGKGENTLLATISSIDPMYVNFSIAEKTYLNFVMRYGAKGRGDETPMRMELILADGLVYAEKGKPDMADREVDPTTGTLGVRAVFPNPDNILKSGQFAKVRFVVNELKNAVIIPQRAVVSFQGSKAVLVVKDDGTVERRPITLGPQAPDNMQVIQEGLKAGDLVISEGVNKIRPGDKVTPQMDSTDESSGTKDAPVFSDEESAQQTQGDAGTPTKEN